MIGFMHSDVTSKDITQMKKYELVDLVLSLMSGADTTVTSLTSDKSDIEPRRALVLSGDDVFDYVEIAVESSETLREKERQQ